MKKLAAAAKLALAHLAQLNKPATALAIAGPLTPIVAAILGANVTAGEVYGWLLLTGAAAAVMQKLESVPEKKASAPPAS